MRSRDCDRLQLRNYHRGHEKYEANINLDKPLSRKLSWGIGFLTDVVSFFARLPDDPLHDRPDGESLNGRVEQRGI